MAYTEIFNSVFISGKPGYSWRIKKKLKDQKVMCEFHSTKLRLGVEHMGIVFLQPYCLEQEILGYIIKFDLSIRIVDKDITVKVEPKKPDWNGQ